jgi:hypothetical protein
MLKMLKRIGIVVLVVLSPLLLVLILAKFTQFTGPAWLADLLYLAAVRMCEEGVVLFFLIKASWLILALLAVIVFIYFKLPHRTP